MFYISTGHLLGEHGFQSRDLVVLIHSRVHFSSVLVTSSPHKIECSHSINCLGRYLKNKHSDKETTDPTYFPLSLRIMANRVLVDWGTTSVRAHLVSMGGETLDTRHTKQGIMKVQQSDLVSVLLSLIEGWSDIESIVMCGMIGSRKGEP